MSSIAVVRLRRFPLPVIPEIDVTLNAEGKNQDQRRAKKQREGGGGGRWLRLLVGKPAHPLFTDVAAA